MINIGDNISTNKWVSPFAKGTGVPKESSPLRNPSPDVQISDLPQDGPLHPLMIVSVKTQSKTVRPSA